MPILKFDSNVKVGAQTAKAVYRGDTLINYNPVANLFANNEQGVWYDPSDFNPTWRRNLLTRSEQFDNADWTKTGTVVTSEALTAPDGTLTADLVKTDTSTGGHQITRTIGINYAPVGSYLVLSFYVKPSGVTKIRIASNNPVTYGVGSSFDLSTGAVTSTSLGSAAIELLDDGWYRVSVAGVVGQAAGTGTNLFLQNASGDVTYTGDGTSGIYIWGAQLEVGSTASTYQRITDGVQDYYTYGNPQPVLFQDSAGTTPVTAVEQPVGLMLDKSKGLVLGPEKFTTFSALGSGWTVEPDGSFLCVNTSGANSDARVDLPVTPGAWHRVSFEVVQSGTAGNNCFAMTTTPFTLGTVPRLWNVSSDPLSATAISRFLIFRCLPGSSLRIRNISVRELPGNHAFQTTAASRPVLSARVNLLTKTEQFDDAAWNPVSNKPTILSNETTAPNGENTADKLVPAALTGTFGVVYNFTFPTGSYTHTIYAKNAGYNRIGLRAYDGTSYFLRGTVDLTTGTMVTDASQRGSWVITNVGNGWWKITVTATSVGVFSGVAIEVLNNTVVQDTWTPNGVDGIFLWGADLRVANDGVNIPAYQRVNTATDYDTANFPLYLRCDGVDDGMVTNSIDFTGTDKMTVWAGVRRLNDTPGRLLELSANWNGNVGTFLHHTGTNPLTGLGTGFSSGSRGTASSSPNMFGIASNASYIAPFTAVTTGLHDISTPVSSIRVNQTAGVNSIAIKGTGTFGNYPLYIGKRGSDGAQPFNGRFYGIIIRGAQSTPAQITSTEQYMNGKTRAY